MKITTKTALLKKETEKNHFRVKKESRKEKSFAQLAFHVCPVANIDRREQEKKTIEWQYTIDQSCNSFAHAECVTNTVSQLIRETALRAHEETKLKCIESQFQKLFFMRANKVFCFCGKTNGWTSTCVAFSSFSRWKIKQSESLTVDAFALFSHTLS